MLMQFRSHGDREPRRRTNVLEFLKDNIGKTQLIKKFIKVEASPAKNFPETKEIPGENIKVEASPTKNSPETKVMLGENIKVEASPTKNFPETKEIPGKSIKKNCYSSNNYFSSAEACSSKENTSNAGPTSTSKFQYG